MKTTCLIDYGEQPLSLELSGLNATLLEPRYPAPLADETRSFREAARAPYGGMPLRQRISADETVAVAIPDITRALPNERLLRWVFAELDHVPAKNFVIISGTGTHRANTPAEWEHMVGRDIYERYRCVDHDGHDPASMMPVGRSTFGYEVSYNREYAQADRRIILGFIEPHFMAGYSGGYKAVFPGVTGVEAILHYHNAENIGHPASTWGVIENNPTQAHVRAGGGLLPVDFCVNITLDRERRITGFFCGDVDEAHAAGCVFCKDTAMLPCAHDFPIVVTSNSGYPLDQNLYQSVKRMSAAAQIVRPGGLILTAARCNDGFPSHGNFRKLLTQHATPDEMLATICAPGFREFDQWQVQVLALILQKARVGLYSGLDDAETRSAHLEPVHNLRTAIDAELQRLGDPSAPVAIIPEGPLTIPYLT
ncbi:MAG: nickel-dependent lactate racemase [Kiritimatiellae bacterium]|jgi:nickel-dependent lactate racemase|nr:nickel-dependent lactate racemase [Kiritimatiellia bacterium]